MELLSQSYARRRTGPRHRSFRPFPKVNGLHFQGYDGKEDQLASVMSVSPAFLEGTRVSTDGVFNGSHLLLKAQKTTGNPIYILVCQEGWLYLGCISRQEEKEGKSNNPPSFNFTTEVALALVQDRLSLGDRKKIVAAVLTHFMGTPNWERLNAYDAEKKRRAEGRWV